MTHANVSLDSPSLEGQKVALVGKLAGMAKREAQQLIRGKGGVVVEQPHAGVDLVVVGEEELPFGENGLEDPDGTLDAAVKRGSLEIITETELWQRLGLVEEEQNVHRLYTPAMLAKLLGVAVSVVRRWHRRGLIVPAREVRRLPYFDFQEVATARRLAELVAAGVSPAAIERKLATLAKFLPGVERPLAQLSIIVEGKQLLLRQGDGLVEPGGQLRFDFQTPVEDDDSESSEGRTSSGVLVLEAHRPHDQPVTPQEMCSFAAELEDDDRLDEAAEMYRAAMAAGGPMPETCFLLAELLYQLGDLSAARERYYMTIELDEDYVEARANLGCVLAEMGEFELARASFEGALAYHNDYPDVHYHLARTLDELGEPEVAELHWRAFVRLSPDSPWAVEARSRLDI